MSRPWLCDLCNKDAVTEARGGHCDANGFRQLYAVCSAHAAEYRAMGWDVDMTEEEEAAE